MVITLRTVVSSRLRPLLLLLQRASYQQCKLLLRRHAKALIRRLLPMLRNAAEPPPPPLDPSPVLSDEDITTLIVLQLEAARDVCTLAQVNRRLGSLCALDQVWQPLCTRRWMGQLLEEDYHAHVAEAAAVARMHPEGASGTWRANLHIPRRSLCAIEALKHPRQKMLLAPHSCADFTHAFEALICRRSMCATASRPFRALLQPVRRFEPACALTRCVIAHDCVCVCLATRLLGWDGVFQTRCQRRAAAFSLFGVSTSTHTSRPSTGPGWSSVRWRRASERACKTGLQ